MMKPGEHAATSIVNRFMLPMLRHEHCDLDRKGYPSGQALVDKIPLREVAGDHMIWYDYFNGEVDSMLTTWNEAIDHDPHLWLGQVKAGPGDDSVLFTGVVMTGA